MPDEISIDEVNKILLELESSLDIKVSEQGASVFEVKEGNEHSFNSDSSLLRFECPTALWEEYSEYCKRNDLDPAQQIREAVISYYMNLWQTYKIRKKHFDKSKLV